VVVNVGSGVFEVHGSRATISDPQMTGEPRGGAVGSHGWRTSSFDHQTLGDESSPWKRRE